MKTFESDLRAHLQITEGLISPDMWAKIRLVLSHLLKHRKIKTVVDSTLGWPNAFAAISQKIEADKALQKALNISLRENFTKKESNIITLLDQVLSVFKLYEVVYCGQYNSFIENNIEFISTNRKKAEDVVADHTRNIIDPIFLNLTIQAKDFFPIPLTVKEFKSFTTASHEAIDTYLDKLIQAKPEYSGKLIDLKNAHQHYLIRALSESNITRINKSSDIPQPKATKSKLPEAPPETDLTTIVQKRQINLTLLLAHLLEILSNHKVYSESTIVTCLALSSGLDLVDVRTLQSIEPHSLYSYKAILKFKDSSQEVTTLVRSDVLIESFEFVNNIEKPCKPATLAIFAKKTLAFMTGLENLTASEIPTLYKAIVNHISSNQEQSAWTFEPEQGDLETITKSAIEKLDAHKISINRRITDKAIATNDLVLQKKVTALMTTMWKTRHFSLDLRSIRQELKCSQPLAFQIHRLVHKAIAEQGELK